MEDIENIEERLTTIEDRLSVLEKKAKRASAGRTPITEDWTPRSEDYEWAEKYSVNLNEETDRFKDYWISKGERRTNWYAAWRNWIRKAPAFASADTQLGQARSPSRTSAIVSNNSQRIGSALDKLADVRRRNSRPEADTQGKISSS